MLIDLAVDAPDTDEDDVSPKHLVWMLQQICTEQITGEKAHRWIGYVQGVLVAFGVTTVAQMRELNRRA